MRNIISRIFGYPLRLLKRAKKYFEFSQEFKKFQNMPGADRLSAFWENRNIRDDRTASTSFDRHYIYHTAWAARILAKTKPKKHVDISSTLYFCGIVSAFIPTEFYDYRPAQIDLDNLRSKKGDLLSLPFEDNSVESLSTLHVVEHIGLGRYGDAIDPNGDLRAMNELKRVLKPGGDLLFVVPMGNPRIVFNAHRIYGRDQIIEYFSGLTLMQFAMLSDGPEESGLIYDAPKKLCDRQKYGMGCFWFQKPAA